MLAARSRLGRAQSPFRAGSVDAGLSERAQDAILQGATGDASAVATDEQRCVGGPAGQSSGGGGATSEGGESDLPAVEIVLEDVDEDGFDGDPAVFVAFAADLDDGAVVGAAQVAGRRSESSCLGHQREERHVHDCDGQGTAERHAAPAGEGADGQRHHEEQPQPGHFRWRPFRTQDGDYGGREQQDGGDDPGPPPAEPVWQPLDTGRSVIGEVGQRVEEVRRGAQGRARHDDPDRWQLGLGRGEAHHAGKEPNATAYGSQDHAVALRTRL